MAIRFCNHSLRYENGTLVLISYQELLKECIKPPFVSVRISLIIFDAINKMTGETVKGPYNDKPLYCWLERNIQQNEEYKAFKEFTLAKYAPRRQRTLMELDFVAYKEKRVTVLMRKKCRDFYRKKSDTK